ncbi:hypothetical protein ACQ86N_41225 [Puia sp. P3]|uniref:hypothetical protein n=1 Tax=Puia sp. P3 TaxID=3423952 RepID=UPI003D675B80
MGMPLLDYSSTRLIIPRSGIRELQLGLNSSVLQKVHDQSKIRDVGYGLPMAGISFAWSTYTPGISIPMTNYNFTFTAKPGFEYAVSHPDFYLAGSYGREYIAADDTAMLVPAYGYLNFQNRGSAWSALTDFNREKEMEYRETPAIPNIAVPSYTYDIFSISGEGNGGMFRAYRGDIGFIADHLTSSKTTTGKLSIDFGAGNLVHGGTDLNANYSVSQAGPWLAENPCATPSIFAKATATSNRSISATRERRPSIRPLFTTRSAATIP